MSAGLRNAALTLHGLAAADRDWILQQLPAPERQALAGLLHELRALGIAPDQGLADQLAHGEARQALLRAGGAASGLAEALDALCAAAPARIAALLGAEPEQMAAVVLAAYPWPWRARLLADCEADRRARLGRALQQAPQLKPRAQAELVMLLAARLAAQGGEAPAGAAAPATARIPAGAARRSISRGWRRWLP